MFQGAGSNPGGSPAFPVLVGKVARRSRTGDLLKVTLTSPLNLTIIILELDGFTPRAEYGPGFCFCAGNCSSWGIMRLRRYVKQKPAAGWIERSGQILNPGLGPIGDLVLWGRKVRKGIVARKIWN